MKSLLLFIVLGAMFVGTTAYSESKKEPKLNEAQANMKCARIDAEATEPHKELICRKEADSAWLASTKLLEAYNSDASDKVIATLQRESSDRFNEKLECLGKFADICVQVMMTVFKN